MIAIKRRGAMPNKKINSRCFTIVHRAIRETAKRLLMSTGALIINAHIYILSFNYHIVHLHTNKHQRMEIYLFRFPSTFNLISRP